MASTRFPETIDAIMAALTAAGVKACDGPTPTGDYSDTITVGFDGDPDGEFEAVQLDQTWAGIGAKRRDEVIVVRCAAIATIGDDPPNATQMVRNAAADLFGAAENALRADPSIGRTPTPYVAEIKPLSMYYSASNGFLQARITFDVSVKTRI